MNKFLSMFLAGALGGLVTLGTAKLLEKPADLSANQPPLAKQVFYKTPPAGFDFTKAAEKSMPAVVHIKASESREAAASRQRREQENDPIRRFFGGDFFNDQQRSGSGSGVIYTSDGYILTNNHVVEFADEFEVTLHDNREFKARVVGKDANTDMAVLKIDAENLPAIELGNSDDVQVGQWALAVGNPFDLASTVTAGIISAKSRDINIIKGKAAQSPIESFLQTDAAVNPGNSGGALVDMDGELIGINSAIATPTGVFAGYAFAIPVNLVKRIADDLIKYGEYRRGYLGVDIAPMDSKLADRLQIPYNQGVAVVNVYADGSAAIAGVQAKDVITKVNGRNVTTTSELLELIARSKAGENVLLNVLRDGKPKEISVKLKPRAQD